MFNKTEPLTPPPFGHLSWEGNAVKLRVVLGCTSLQQINFPYFLKESLPRFGGGEI
jgi:hypothetical protein